MGSNDSFVYKVVPRATIGIAEKKGLGNPDAICDELAERVSATYSRYCFENYGVIVPSIIDGLTMDEGSSFVEFGRGEMIKPIRLYLRGTFYTQYMGKKIPYIDIAKSTIYDYLDATIPNLNARKWVRIIDGTQSYAGPEKTFAINELVANHMYVVSAHYPPTPTESGALRVEQLLSSPTYRASHPYLGTDNKVIYIQNGNSVDIEAYVSMDANRVESAEALEAYRSIVEDDIIAAVATERIRVGEIEIYSSNNPLHDPRVLTATGSSVENSNGGAIGQSRYPVYHAAKIYSVLCYRISKHIFNSERLSAAVTIISKAGRPMDSPWRTIIEIQCKQGEELVSPALKARIREIVEEETPKIEEIVKELMYSKTKSY